MQVTIYDSESLKLYSDAIVSDDHGYLIPAHGMPQNDDLHDAIETSLMAYQDHGITTDSIHDYVSDSITHFWTITE